MQRDSSREVALSRTELSEKATDAAAVSGLRNNIRHKGHEKDTTTDFMLSIVEHVDMNAEQISLALQSDVHLNALKKVIRYDDTEWNVDRPSDELTVLLGRILNYQTHNSASPAAIPVSEIVDIQATSAEPTRLMERVDVVEKYDLFRQELGGVASAAGNRFSNPVVLSDLLTDLQEGVTFLLNKCHADVSMLGQVGTVEYRSRQVSLERLELAGVLIDRCLSSGTIDVASYAELFSVLSKHRRLYASLRKLAFALTFQRRLPLQSMFTELPEQPNINAIEQIDYFVNEEVIGNVFNGVFEQDYVAYKFKGMCKTGPIEKTAHEKSAATGGIRRMQFIPTKGVLRELAAYIGDSCYAAKGELMAEKHPNVTAVIMKQINRGSGEERFVGSSLLIETTDTDGNKVVVIRALNPIENIINKLSVSDFYDQFTSYVKSATGDDYSGVGIVIDNRAGGAATNRPLLFNYLKHLRDDGILEPMGVSRGDTILNDFDISDKVYRV